MHMKKRRLLGVEENVNGELGKKARFLDIMGGGGGVCKFNPFEHNNNNGYGDGVAWYRGPLIGRGNFGSVFIATLKNPKSRYSSYPPVMAVKSAEVSVSGSIQKEREVLNNLRGCPYVIKCYGEETTNGVNGEMVFNLLLEYGSGGTLADFIGDSGRGGLPEFEVRCFARSILHGLSHIHWRGYVHCDLKPENILLVCNRKDVGGAKFRAKIGDLGLAKRAEQSKKRKLLDPYWRGTPMYLSPEAVIEGIQGPPSDIWALGCIVLEMLTGKPPWNSEQDSDASDILGQIESNRLPTIPSTISEEGKSFLKGCFARKAMFRFTAEMLLNHPFLEGLVDDDVEVEEVEEIPDVNAITSLTLVAELDDELRCSYSSDEWSNLSEEEFEFGLEADDDDNIDSEEGFGSYEELALELHDTPDVTFSAVPRHPLRLAISAGV